MARDGIEGPRGIENREVIDSIKTEKKPKAYKSRVGGTYEVDEKSLNSSLPSRDSKQNNREKTEIKVSR